MTTIAFDGKTMAGDGRLNNDGLIVTDGALKVRRVTDRLGRSLLVGFCGTTCYWEKLEKWLAGQGDYPGCHQGDSWTLLVWDGQELAKYYSDGDERDVVPVPHAIGSGWPCAMTAMKMGADAVRAVEMAITMDVYSGGQVTAIEL